MYIHMIYPVKRATKFINENYPCVCHKNRRKNNKHFELLFTF